MNTRCKPGDLAIILRDYGGCDSNVGRIVKVHGPVGMCDFWGPKWLIEATSPEPWYFTEWPAVLVTPGPMTLSDRIEHPDCWMQPIRPQSAEQGQRVSSAKRKKKATSRTKVADHAEVA